MVPGSMGCTAALWGTGSPARGVRRESGTEPQLKYLTTVNTISEIPSVQKYSVPHFPVFDLGVPDQFRVDLWQKNFSADVVAGTVPALSVLWIMCDHTGGPPSSAAEQADNDLAIGRIVDAISHSNVWGSSARAGLEQARLEIFKGKQHSPDSEDPYTVNHMEWYEATDYKRPYPGETKVLWPSAFATDRTSKS